MPKILIEAVKDSSYTSVKRWIEEGKNPNCDDSKGVSALMWAAYDGAIAIVQCLLRSPHIAINHQCLRDYTALMTAARGKIGMPEEGAPNHHAEIVRELICHGADMSLKNDRGQTALDIANEAKHYDAVCILEEAGAKK